MWMIRVRAPSGNTSTCLGIPAAYLLGMAGNNMTTSLERYSAIPIATTDFFVILQAESQQELIDKLCKGTSIQLEQTYALQPGIIEQ